MRSGYGYGYGYVDSGCASVAPASGALKLGLGFTEAIEHARSRQSLGVDLMPTDRKDATEVIIAQRLPQLLECPNRFHRADGANFTSGYAPAPRMGTRYCKPLSPQSTNRSNHPNIFRKPLLSSGNARKERSARPMQQGRYQYMSRAFMDCRFSRGVQITCTRLNWNFHRFLCYSTGRRVAASP